MVPAVLSLITVVAIVVLSHMAVLTPSNRQLNVLSCTFTPTGGSATTIKGVQSATLAWNADNLSEGGDGDLYDTTTVLVKLAPMVTLEFLNVNALSALAPGVTGVLAYTLGDSKNLALTAGGATIYTISNAIYSPQQTTANFRQLARHTAVFNTASTDGQTSPIAQAAA